MFQVQNTVYEVDNSIKYYAIYIESFFRYTHKNVLKSEEVVL